MFDNERIYMIDELESMAAELDDQIRAEEERTGIRDSGHCLYSAIAQSARLRRDEFRWSIAELSVDSTLPCDVMWGR